MIQKEADVFSVHKIFLRKISQYSPISQRISKNILSKIYPIFFKHCVQSTYQTMYISDEEASYTELQKNDIHLSVSGGCEQKWQKYSENQLPISRSESVQKQKNSSHMQKEFSKLRQSQSVIWKAKSKLSRWDTLVPSRLILFLAIRKGR